MGAINLALEHLQQAIAFSPNEYRAQARIDLRSAPLHLYRQFQRLLESS